MSISFLAFFGTICQVVGRLRALISVFSSFESRDKASATSGLDSGFLSGMKPRNQIAWSLFTGQGKLLALGKLFLRLMVRFYDEMIPLLYSSDNCQALFFPIVEYLFCGSDTLQLNYCCSSFHYHHYFFFKAALVCENKSTNFLYQKAIPGKRLGSSW